MYIKYMGKVKWCMHSLNWKYRNCLRWIFRVKTITCGDVCKKKNNQTKIIFATQEFENFILYMTHKM